MDCIINTQRQKLAALTRIVSRFIIRATAVAVVDDAAGGEAVLE